MSWPVASYPDQAVAAGCFRARMRYHENMGFGIKRFFPWIFFLVSVTLLGLMHIELIGHVVTINMHGSVM